MDAAEFKKRGREVVDYIADYMTNIRTRRVTPDVEPGYIRELLPSTAPKKGEDWDKIMEDFERAVMPGITHWQHPNFHAYFPAGNSYPSIIGDMLSDAIGCIGFSWAASPACTELETLMLDWVGIMIGLPEEFLHTSGKGGGVIQGSASESVLVALLSARHRTIKLLKQNQPYMEDCQILSKLVGYCSKLAHSCVEKAGMIGFVKMRHLDVDENYSLRGHVLEDAIEEDKKLGLIPFFACATLGTTACCSFDNLSELGEVTSRQGVYLHVDAAYAGNALICQEFHYLKNGVENVDSFSFNTNKWLQVNFDCSLMWVKNVDMLTTALTVDPLYLQHKHGDKAIDLRHWGIPLSRRFRALKLWFVIRIYGVEGLQKRIREHCRLAKLFESKVLSDERFEILGEVTMGLVCFRLQGPNSLTQRLLKTINDSGKLHMVPAMLNEHYIIRFVLCTEYACDEDISFAWKVITAAATELMQARHGYDSNKKNDEDTFAAFDEEIIFDNQREHLQRAQIMRSLFFKMVSDPKCYNPRVLKSLGRQLSSSRYLNIDDRECPTLSVSQSLKSCGNKSTHYSKDYFDLDISASNQYERKNLSKKEQNKNNTVCMDLRATSENIDSKRYVQEKDFNKHYDSTKSIPLEDATGCDVREVKVMKDRTKIKYLTTDETLRVNEINKHIYKEKEARNKNLKDKEAGVKDSDESI